MANQFYRSRDEKIIAGVAAGLSEGLNLSPAVTRLIFVIMLFAGIGLPIYILLWILLPKKTFYNTEPMENHEQKPKRNEGNIIAGLILIGLGVLFLIIRYFPELDFRDLWPYILIVVGAFLLFKGFRSN